MTRRKQPSELAPGSRARAFSMAAVVARIDRICDWLGKHQVRDVVALCQQPEPGGLGLGRRMANRYVGAALARMQTDASIEPLESKRARLIAMVYQNMDDARKNTRTFTNKDGETSEYPQPDYRAVNQGIALLAELEGLRGGST